MPVRPRRRRGPPTARRERRCVGASERRSVYSCGSGAGKSEVKFGRVGRLGLIESRSKSQANGLQQASPGPASRKALSLSKGHERRPGWMIRKMKSPSGARPSATVVPPRWGWVRFSRFTPGRRSRLAGPGLACRRAFGPLRSTPNQSAWPSQVPGTSDCISCASSSLGTPLSPKLQLRERALGRGTPPSLPPFTKRSFADRGRDQAGAWSRGTTRPRTRASEPPLTARFSQHFSAPWRWRRGDQPQPAPPLNTQSNNRKTKS